MIVTELIFLSIITIVNGIVGRCYLCSQETLAECVGSNQLDSSIYIAVLQYYTEPCNGQCVLFQNENRSIVRGCSWTYGHMTPKSIGWHEISPGIKAYFCDSHLCNNGTYEQPNKSMIKNESQQLIRNDPLQLKFNEFFSRQLRPCYSCTARYQGCGEFLDPHYASKYIRSCSTSCVIFRNPHDLNLITRDCSLFWPQVHAKSGLHKLLDSDAYFCQESLCNGISFDFIMGIFHNQFPAVITFPSIHINENTSTTTTTTTTTTTINNISIESTTVAIFNNSTDYIDQIPFDNHTIINNISINEINVTLNSSDLNDTFSSTTIQSKEDDWMSFNTSSIEMITTFEHLSLDDDDIEFNSSIDDDDDDDDDDYIIFSSTPTIDFLKFVPYYFLNNQTFEYIQPLVIPPFSWILNMVNENTSQLLNSTITTTTTTTEIPETSYEYCKNKQCHHGGRLNSDCLCICLPTFTGDNCETVLCEDEPADICSFILEHECQTRNIRYLCPKFCQLDICLPNPA